MIDAPPRALERAASSPRLPSSSPERRPSRARTAPAHPVRGIILRVAGGFLLVFGLFLAYLLSVSYLTEGRGQAVLLSEFKTSLTLLQGQGSEPPAGAPVGLLQIPSIGLQKMIVQGIGSDQTEIGPGHDPSTPLPGQVSNVVLVGRRYSFGAPFQQIDSLSKGDQIVVYTRQGRFVYQVQAVGAQPLGSDAVTQPTDDPRLTLITYGPWDRQASELVVAGELVGHPLAPPDNVSVRPTGQRVGASTGTGAVLGIVVWAEAFIVSVVLAVLLFRRWSTAATFLLTTPLLATSLFLLFENVVRALPPAL